MDFLKRSAERSEYRIISAILVLSEVPIAIAILEGWVVATWISFLIAVSSGLLLIFLTYRRLRNASLSAWWLSPMLLSFHVGPSWHLGAFSYWPSGLIALVPVIIGWFAPSSRERDSWTATLPD